MDLRLRTLPVVGLRMSLWMALLARRRSLLYIGVVVALVWASPLPAGPPTARDAFVGEFSGEAVRSGNAYRLDVFRVPAFLVGNGVVFPLGTVDATVQGAVADVLPVGSGVVPPLKVGVGRATVWSDGRPSYSLSHLKWVSLGAGFGLATGRVRSNPGANVHLNDSFQALFKIRPLAGASAVRTSIVLGSIYIGSGRDSSSPSRLKAF